MRNGMPGWLGERALWRWMLAAHLLFLFGIYHTQGIVLDKEALKYSGGASDVLNGDLTDLMGRYKLFSAYILFLVPFTALGSAAWAIPVQVLLMWTAALAMFRILRRLEVPVPAANLLTAVFLLAHPIQCWVLSLYSEAFFIPLVVLFLERSLRGRNFDAATLSLALLVLFSRPTGVLFVLPVLVWWLSSRIPGSATTVRAGGVLAVLIAMAFTPVLNREQLEVVVGSPVICGFPEHPEAVDLFQGNTLAAAQGHVIAEHGLVYWAGLVLRRSVSLLVPYRSYFSPVHNGLGLLLVLLYPLVLVGLWRTWKEPLVQVITVVLVLNILLVGMTYDEWGARFLAPLLPLVILLAATVWVPNRHIPSRLHSPSATTVN